MTVYVALLRGINVGGNKKVSMPLLKAMFEKLGYERVSTYINSGNVVFDAVETAESADMLEDRLSREIEKTFGFPVDVIVRSAADMARIVANNPFAEEGPPENLNLHVGFMSELPSPAKLERLMPFVNENDEFRIVDMEIYVAFRAGVRDSKLGNNLNKLGVPITLRNWNTTNKLLAMVGAT